MTRTKTYRLQTCKCGRQTKRLFYTEVGKRCGDCISREGLKKTGAPEYQSRARRLSSALADISSSLESEEELSDDLSAIEELKDEVESWRDNMSGTALENTSKYMDVEQAFEDLKDGLGSLESAVSSYNEAASALSSKREEIGEEPTDDQQDELDDLEGELMRQRSDVEDAIAELEGVSFPGMY